MKKLLAGILIFFLIFGNSFFPFSLVFSEEASLAPGSTSPESPFLAEENKAIPAGSLDLPKEKQENSSESQATAEQNTDGEANAPVNPSVQLLITELFLIKGKEFIEIKNIADQEFNGTLTLQRTKTKKQNFEARIPAGAYFLLAKDTKILGEIPTIYLDLDFPKSNFSLALFANDQEIESIKISKKLIEQSLENSASLERISQSAPDFSPVIFERSTSSSEHYFVNPGGAFDEIEEREKPGKLDPQTNEEWEGKLILTEVFLHKDNSRFEVSNLSEQDYQGNLRISGLHKTKTFEYEKVEIPAKSSLVIARNERYLDEKVKFLITNDRYTFDWKSDFETVLSYGKEQQDRLFVHQDWIKKLKNADLSFQKVLNNGEWITTRTNLDQKENIRGNFLANPGIYLIDQENSKAIDQVIPKEKDTPKQGEEENQKNCGEIEEGILQIEEIFGGNQIYPSFIELKFMENPKKYSHLKLKGSLLEEEIIIEKDDELWTAQKTFLLSVNNARDEQLIDHIVVPNLLLKESGELSIEGLDGQDRQVLDKIIVDKNGAGQSSYFEGNKKTCQRLFDSHGDFSPGFERKFLKFFAINAEPKIEYIYINKGGGGSCSCPTKEDLCPLTKKDASDTTENKKQETESKVEKENKNQTSVDENPLFDAEKYRVKIEDIVYDPPGSDKNKESITLVLTAGETLNLKYTTLIINRKKKKLTGILQEGKSQTLIGNFGFPNKGLTTQTVKVELALKDQILDTFYYTLSEKNQIEKLKEKQNPEGYKVFSVIDGDTIRYRDENGKLQSVRLLGVDAPESNTARYKKLECFGKEAKNHLTETLKGKYVRLEFDSQAASKDRYGRRLAYVYLGDRLINAELIKQGFAKEYTYKTDYDQQKFFQNLQTQAKNEKRGLWNPLHCPDVQEQQDQPYIQNLVLKITDIIYDPKGSDKGNEQLTLMVYDKSGLLTEIDFTQQFGLFLFEKTGDQQVVLEDFEYGKGKFIDLAFLGTRKSEKNLTLEGDFSLPNHKATCLALVQKEHIFDIACYDPKQKEEESTDQLSTFSGTIKILSLLPNPKGKDKNKESIELLYTSEENETLELNKDFYLQTNGKGKKSLTGTLIAGKAQHLIGNYNFPNTSACVELRYQNQSLDRFCYGKEKEGAVISKSQEIFEKMEKSDFELLKDLKLKKIGQELCMTYQHQKLECRKLPKTRIDPKLKQEIQMTRSAFKTFENELRKNYTPLFYQSDIKEIFTLFHQAKSDIKAGKNTYFLGKKEYLWKDFGKIYQAKKERNLIDEIRDFVSPWFPEDFFKHYKQKEQEWKENIEQQNS